MPLSGAGADSSQSAASATTETLLFNTMAGDDSTSSSAESFGNIIKESKV